MSTPARLDRALRSAVLLAGLAITARWEHAYGALLGLGPLAWAVPVLTSGYLWLAIRRDRDVAAAVALALASTVAGAVSGVVHVPPVLLAVATATLVAVISYRAHVVQHAAPAPAPVAVTVEPADVPTEPAVPVAPVLPAPRPAVEDALPAAVEDLDLPPAPEATDGESDRDVVARIIAEHAHLDATAQRRLARAALPHLTASAVRGLHHRITAAA